MKARVRVENGRITGDAPPGTPDGEIELARLNEALARGFEQIKVGSFVPPRM